MDNKWGDPASWGASAPNDGAVFEDYRYVGGEACQRTLNSNWPTLSTMRRGPITTPAELLKAKPANIIITTTTELQAGTEADRRHMKTSVEGFGLRP